VREEYLSRILIKYLLIDIYLAIFKPITQYHYQTQQKAEHLLLLHKKLLLSSH